MARLRLLLRLQELFVFIGVIVYALLTALNQRPPLGIILLCILVVANLLVPFATVGRHIYEHRPFPWNWILFLPMQLALGLASAMGSVLLLRWTGLDPQPFWTIFREFGPFIIVICMVVGVVMFGVDHVQRKLKEKNLQLEQAVEKGTIAIQEQEEEMKRAREIQQALLPKTLPQLAGAQIAGAWQPARAVGGDYFDVIRLGEKRVGICVGDVAGKGITAALLMANLQASFRAFATPDASPSTVCSKLNKFLCGNIAPGKFVTFFYGILDTEHRTFQYENAGHCPAYRLNNTGEAEILRGEGAVLGVMPEWNYSDSVVPLAAGDRLLLFTDGITEAENERLEEFGENKLVQAAQLNGASAQETQRGIMDTVSRFCGANFRDDATLLVAAIL
jgi:phosphoserine phosphatase RsbU/P